MHKNWCQQILMNWCIYISIKPQFYSVCYRLQPPLPFPLTLTVSPTMRTPNDHQSAAVLWPLRFTTSGAMYSTVPQNEYVFFSSNIDSLLKPKSVSLMWPSWSSRMLQGTICQSVTLNRDQDTNKGPLCLWGTVLNYIQVIHSLSRQCYDGNEHWNVWKQILSDIHVVVIREVCHKYYESL